jgi:hypothetical protein
MLLQLTTKPMGQALIETDGEQTLAAQLLQQRNFLAMFWLHTWCFKN